ncbi:MAG: bifunctional diaminohydroxyphosphoribosylaminopyrimidine deaminase/5-amino-6-(5-phosphoribosylamino)uracil reductase RibD [Bacteroidia bacterium]|nr:bifunctional diaminohydroxyphosphoribosylaminopyrimidine deaminase/5-amino-6-(5-phosphoribosylamino)uracil reductase RibD [Bacteroidia bacterium]
MKETEHSKYIKRCFQIAENGLGYVAPNPLVGCVIVYNGLVLSEGYHIAYGKNHAEVNAIEKIKDKHLLKEGTLYVNLEPCAHYGKTPPCADLIIKHQLKKVVISNTDPNPLVAGKGIEKLRTAGIEVITDILSEEGKFLNRRFFTWITKKRPYIILKWAQSLDGFIWSENKTNITENHFNLQNHLWRTQESAIMVGKNTVIKDNPLLTARHVAGKQPTRIVTDFSLLINKEKNIFNTHAPTVILNGIIDKQEENILYKKAINNSVQSYLQALYELNIQSVIVEGGAQLLNSFISSGVYDEVRMVIGNCFLGTGIKAPVINGSPNKIENFSEDKLLTFYHLNT